MENIFLIIVVLLIFIILLINFNNTKTKNKLQVYKDIIQQATGLPIVDTINYRTFLDKMLEDKFQYYLTSYILAYFIQDKEIDKKEIIKLKNDFYVDIASTLNPRIIMDLHKIFTKQGLVLYIHQTFLKLLNDANIKFKNNAGELPLTRKNLEILYK